MPSYIFFYNGRHSSDEELDDWGFNGPVVGPYSRIAFTYGCHIKAIDEKEKITDFTIGTEGLVEVLGAFYGDFIIIDEKKCKENYNDRRMKTKEIFVVPEKNLPLLINEKEEWVKIYIERSLNGSLTPKPPSPRRSNWRPGRGYRKGS
jgi:hypothetical protein